MRRLFCSGAALTLGVIAALAIVEIALRALSLAPSAGIFTVSKAEFARVPGLFSHGQWIIDRQIAGLPYHVHIDSLGFRGREIDRHKTPK